jgi:hypothetical protein
MSTLTLPLVGHCRYGEVQLRISAPLAAPAVYRYAELPPMEDYAMLTEEFARSFSHGAPYGKSPQSGEQHE